MNRGIPKFYWHPWLNHYLQTSSHFSFPLIKMLIARCWHKQEPMLTIQSAISVGKSIKILLDPHNVITFFSDGGIGWFMACQSTFSSQSLPIPEFNYLKQVKYLCRTFEYLQRPAIMESSSKKVWIAFLKGDNSSGYIVNNLIFKSSNCT